MAEQAVLGVKCQARVVAAAGAAPQPVTPRRVGQAVLAAAEDAPAPTGTRQRALTAARGLLHGRFGSGDALAGFEAPSVSEAHAKVHAAPATLEGPPREALAPLNATMASATRAFAAPGVRDRDTARLLQQVTDEVVRVIAWARALNVPRSEQTTHTAERIAAAERQLGPTLKAALRMRTAAAPRAHSVEGEAALLRFDATCARLSAWCADSTDAAAWLAGGCFDHLVATRARPRKEAPSPAVPRPEPGALLTPRELQAAVRHHQRIDDVWATHRTLKQSIAFLGIAEADLPQYAGKRVLSVGEGAASFMRDLEREHGADAVAVDRWYGWSLEKLRKDLVLASATTDRWKILDPVELDALLPSQRVAANAEDLPFAREFDAVFMANLLFWFLDPMHPAAPPPGGADSGWRMLSEGLRVLRDDGELRFNMHSRGGARLVAAEIRRRADVLAPGRRLEVEHVGRSGRAIAVRFVEAARPAPL